MHPTTPRSSTPLRLAYLVSHPIQYQSPLLRLIAAEPDIELTVFFGSDFSLRAYRDEGFGVDVAWDTPLTEGFRHVFLPALRDNGTATATTPLSHGIFRALTDAQGRPAFDALWVHGYASVNSLHGILAAKALGIPVLLRSDSWLGDRIRRGPKLVVKRLFLAAVREAVAATLPCGSLNRDYWRAYFGDDFPQFLLPYAVDNEFFAARTAAAMVSVPGLRSTLNLAPDRPVVLFASKLQTRKHCDHLVAAFAGLLSTAPNANPRPALVIAGDGEERAALEQQVRTLQLDADVRFVGFQNQTSLPAYFALASVFVLPARHEPWGLIVNEVMAAGRPVIVSDHVGAHPDLITRRTASGPIEIGAEGIVYPTGNISALTQSLQHILADPATAPRMGQAAAARIARWSFREDIAGLREALAHTTRKIRP